MLLSVVLNISKPLTPTLNPPHLLRVLTHHHHSPLPAPAAGLSVYISVQYVVTQLCCICPLKKWLGLRSVFILPCNLHVGTRHQNLSTVSLPLLPPFLFLFVYL